MTTNRNDINANRQLIEAYQQTQQIDKQLNEATTNQIFKSFGIEDIFTGNQAINYVLEKFPKLMKGLGVKMKDAMFEWDDTTDAFKVFDFKEQRWYEYSIKELLGSKKIPSLMAVGALWSPKNIEQAKK